MIRMVRFFEYKCVKGESIARKHELGIGEFRGFGVDYDEFETGPGNYSTAIIELPDGSVKSVYVQLFEFIK